MKIKITSTIFAAGLAFAATTGMATDASAARTNGQDRNNVNMEVFGPSRAPIGHVNFCRSFPSECRGGTATPQRPRLNADTWNELVAVNNHVNQTVTPVTDMKLYRTVEYWTYPQSAGDCEDYVLEKQRMLVSLGWPIESLLITVVRDENGDGHAILTVTTQQGDFLLDNRRSEILRWQQSHYTFRKRQSQTNPAMWVSLTDSKGIFDSFWKAQFNDVSASNE